MVKKLFFGLLFVLTLLVLFIVYQKINPSSGMMFNPAKNYINQAVVPTGQSSTSSSTTSVPTPTNPAGIFLDVTAPADNVTVATSTVIVSGKTVANADVTVNDQDLKADAQGNFSATVTVEEGQNDIYVVASDALGNSSEKDLTVNLESTQ